MKSGYGAHESRCSQLIEDLRHCQGRIAAGRRLFRDTPGDSCGSEINRVEHEFIRMFCLDFMSLEDMIGEISEVGRDDGLRTAPNGCCENVLVAVVREFKCIFQMLEPFHDAIRNRIAHQRASSGKRRGAEVGSSRQDAVEALVQYSLRPPSPNDASVGDTHQQVAEGSWV